MFGFFKKNKHSWKYYNRKDDPEIWDYDRSYYQYRICQNTGDVEECITHCFGLNPPMYDKSWYKRAGKPVMTKTELGEWYVSRIKR